MRQPPAYVDCATRVGRFSVVDAIAEGRLVPLLEEYNPGDVELIHAVFVGGATVPARVRTFVVLPR